MDREKKHFVRWKTISLRGLMVLILSFALWLGWVNNKARQQREAVAAVQKCGGFVHDDWEVVTPFENRTRVRVLPIPSRDTLSSRAKPWAPG